MRRSALARLLRSEVDGLSTGDAGNAVRDMGDDVKISREPVNDPTMGIVSDTEVRTRDLAEAYGGLTAFEDPSLARAHVIGQRFADRRKQQPAARRQHAAQFGHPSVLKLFGKMREHRERIHQFELAVGKRQRRRLPVDDRLGERQVALAPLHQPGIAVGPEDLDAVESRQWRSTRPQPQPKSSSAAACSIGVPLSAVSLRIAAAAPAPLARKPATSRLPTTSKRSRAGGIATPRSSISAVSSSRTLIARKSLIGAERRARRSRRARAHRRR